MRHRGNRVDITRETLLSVQKILRAMGWEMSHIVGPMALFRISSTEVSVSIRILRATSRPTWPWYQKCKSSFTDAKERQIILGAIENEYHKKTCIRWRPFKRGDRRWVEFKSNQRGCFSSVGMQDGGQIINLQRSGCMYHYIAAHEMMHAIGFFHQQSASNRDDFINIHRENIQQGKERQFLRYGSDFVNDFGVGYDYSSVMHYSRNAFSVNGQPTMTPKVSGRRRKSDGFGWDRAYFICHFFFGRRETLSWATRKGWPTKMYRKSLLCTKILAEKRRWKYVCMQYRAAGCTDDCD